MPNSKLFYLLAAVALFLFSAGASYWIFTSFPRSQTRVSSPSSATPSPIRKAKVDPSLPRTETCPLNGSLFTKSESDVWVTRRPLGIMIENSPDSRPQSGISSADVVYETVAEGGITRFMAVFYCDAALSGNLMVAPVRSARIYFVNLIAEYDGLYNHVGGAGNCDDPNVDPRAKALCTIHRQGIKDLDQFGLDFKTCHRVTNRLDHDVAYEHTMACFLDELYSVAAVRKWTNVDPKGTAWDKNFIPWKFKTQPDKIIGSPATSITYYFWGVNRGVGESFNKDFDVSWVYNTSSNSYTRSNGGQVSTDLNTGEPLQFSTVIVQFARETATADIEKHLLYDVIGTGKALVFIDGQAVDGTWSKSSMKARTIFKDLKGKEILLTPGRIWISILPTGNQVTYN